MKTCFQWFCGVLLTVAAATVIADAPHRVLWDKRPISIHLQVGHERIIHFPDDVRYWLPDMVKRQVSALAANGVLYVRATESFPTTRIRVQGLNDQQVYLLDITASEAAAASDELIVMTKESTRNRSKEVAKYKTTDDWRVRLTRYAAQQLYAPERLVDGDSAIKRIPVESKTSIPLIRGGLIEAVPIASWQGHGLTVTAVRVRNLSRQSLQLQFDRSDSHQALNLSYLVRGDWLTATLQHDRLGEMGSETDTTTLYLVSNRSFVESLSLPIDNRALQNRQTGKEETQDG
ncbi:TIGR03749 family integrating conjugative element protein [Pseudomaricurvus alkylphenolicus]|uniref:TIGR03749 family integrating conjugative element protein n=1 Tax=Pseudomaricurvus alkylphenolicus TaxID=1306991 RepID=UPI001423669A|nr:TIGR03749 family integrating conjugative element protein [Pseudomaricurvus alkylphenolicus]NIB39767.1 TIGR03749 family integrating conjugative element protein [Pseudomaricurvus alkylphenolicus]